MQRKPHHVVFISKQNCHMCDEMWNELMKAARQIPIVIRTQTVTADDTGELATYREKVPVLLIDGGEAFRYRATAREIVEAIRKLQ